MERHYRKENGRKKGDYKRLEGTRINYRGGAINTLSNSAHFPAIKTLSSSAHFPAKFLWRL